MKYSKLISHFRKFTSGLDRSTNWAKDAESILDDLDEQSDLIDEMQEHLALYRPEGGSHLLNEREMLAFVERIIRRLDS